MINGNRRKYFAISVLIMFAFIIFSPYIVLAKDITTGSSFGQYSLSVGKFPTLDAEDLPTLDAEDLPKLDEKDLKKMDKLPELDKIPKGDKQPSTTSSNPQQEEPKWYSIDSSSYKTFKYVLNDTLKGLVSKADGLYLADNLSRITAPEGTNPNFVGLTPKDVVKGSYFLSSSLVRGGITLGLDGIVDKDQKALYEAGLDGWSAIDNGWQSWDFFKSTRDVKHISDFSERSIQAAGQSGSYLGKLFSKVTPVTAVVGGLFAGYEAVQNVGKIFNANTVDDGIDASGDLVANVGEMAMAVAPFLGPVGGVVALAGAGVFAVGKVVRHRKAIGDALSSGWNKVKGWFS
ncbi:hypothetical protein [Baia soyae]|uniref:Uncharacterized protein n=1 Tax=Baia soyae TaxID=1544746 RepID=A0A4R2S184_9BACL|nr:hypothetical protein [Baia soyae]TCP69234.1 hypothetical protein EDD57_11131 [Baia soyae]